MTEPIIVLQPDRPYSELLRLAFDSGSYDHARAAFAYITRSGVDVFDKLLGKAANGNLPTKWEWLSSIDWCRSDPDALSALDGKKGHSVRIHDGRRVVRRSRCTPIRSFHPKSLILTGPGGAAFVLGSGNLSGNGLQRGHEWGTLLLWKGANPKTVAQVAAAMSHFGTLWRAASQLSDIVELYEAAYEKSATSPPAPLPTDDDAVEFTGRGIPLGDLASMRSANGFGIEFLPNENRGEDKAGNQLMMSRNMRVYFGFPARDLPKDSPIGTVELVYRGHRWQDQALRFSNNSMDVLNLPVPGRDGVPNSYDNKLIEFRRLGQMQFEMQIHEGSRKKKFLQKARSAGTLRRMKSGRPWGWD